MNALLPAEDILRIVHTARCQDTHSTAIREIGPNRFVVSEEGIDSDKVNLDFPWFSYYRRTETLHYNAGKLTNQTMINMFGRSYVGCGVPGWGGVVLDRNSHQKKLCLPGVKQQEIVINSNLESFSHENYFILPLSEDLQSQMYQFMSCNRNNIAVIKERQAVILSYGNAALFHCEMQEDQTTFSLVQISSEESNIASIVLKGNEILSVECTDLSMMGMSYVVQNTDGNKLGVKWSPEECPRFEWEAGSKIVRGQVTPLGIEAENNAWSLFPSSEDRPQDSYGSLPQVTERLQVAYHFFKTVLLGAVPTVEARSERRRGPEHP